MWLTLMGHSDSVHAVAFSRDGQTLASASGDCTVKIWNVHSGRVYQTLVGHRSYVFAVTISPDGKVIASASADKTIRLWVGANSYPSDLYTIKDKIEGHSSSVRAVAFSPDSKLLASGSDDGAIMLWDPRQPGAHDWKLDLIFPRSTP
jgi:WD40 repeat protein